MLMTKESTPTFTVEEGLWNSGRRHIAGLDEAGRGALAGPVVAAAVVAPFRCQLSGVWSAVRDSKQLSPRQRSLLADAIRHEALSWGIGAATSQEIDQMGIAAATQQAMSRALQALSPTPDYLLVDWVRLPQINIAQQSSAKADARIVSVAAASILAKVHRDQLLIELDNLYPGYQFAAHKGYGSDAHLRAIALQGPCPMHRRSFAPFRTQMPLFDAAEFSHTPV